MSDQFWRPVRMDQWGLYIHGRLFWATDGTHISVRLSCSGLIADERIISGMRLPPAVRWTEFVDRVHKLARQVGAYRREPISVPDYNREKGSHWISTLRATARRQRMTQDELQEERRQINRAKRLKRLGLKT